MRRNEDGRKDRIGKRKRGGEKEDNACMVYLGNENREGEDEKGKDAKLKRGSVTAQVQSDTLFVDPCEMPLPHAGFGFPHLFKPTTSKVPSTCMYER